MINGSVELLGHVTVPSGNVVVVDTGTLELWNHDQPPQVPEGSGPDDFVWNAHLAREFAIQGPDAETAGHFLNRSPDPVVVFDVRPDFEDQLRAEFEQVRARHGLTATLVPLPHRITHASRVRNTLARNHDGGAFRFQNMDGVVIPGVPREAELPVVGRRLADNPESEEWDHISLECRPELTTHTQIPLGLVAVDWARLMFVDFEALAHWQHNDSLDGLADVAFWGADAETVARVSGAARLSDGSFGWENGPEADLAEVYLKLDELRAQRRYRFACDYRPHSHHYAVMKQLRASQTGSGSLEVGGTRLCAFMTGCGDGFFPVFREVDSAGRLVRVRICFRADSDRAEESEPEQRPVEIRRISDV